MNSLRGQGNYKYLFQECTVSGGNGARILSKFPKLIDPNRETEQADPLLWPWDLSEGMGRKISRASGSCCGQPGAIDTGTQDSEEEMIIPEVCQHYNLPCITLII